MTKIKEMKNFEKHLWEIVKNKNNTKGHKKSALKKIAEIQKTDFSPKYDGNKGWIISDDYIKILENQKNKSNGRK